MARLSKLLQVGELIMTIVAVAARYRSEMETGIAAVGAGLVRWLRWTVLFLLPALLDSLHFSNKRCSALLGTIDKKEKEKKVSYAGKIKSSAMEKRIGYICMGVPPVLRRRNQCVSDWDLKFGFRMQKQKGIFEGKQARGT